MYKLDWPRVHEKYFVRFLSTRSFIRYCRFVFREVPMTKKVTKCMYGAQILGHFNVYRFSGRICQRQRVSFKKRIFFCRNFSSIDSYTYLSRYEAQDTQKFILTLFYVWV
jgi:hypothetical protein